VASYRASFSRISWANCVHLQVSSDRNTSVTGRGRFNLSTLFMKFVDHNLAVDVVEINQEFVWVLDLDAKRFQRLFPQRSPKTGQ